MTRRRLDAELVHRGLARSREHARGLVQDGRVVLAGRSLRVVEEREDALLPMIAAGWLGTILATFAVVLFLGWVKDRRRRAAA